MRVGQGGKPGRRRPIEGAERLIRETAYCVRDAECLAQAA